MHHFLNLNVLILLVATVVTSVCGVNIPVAGNLIQIQPTQRGSFPRTPCVGVNDVVDGIPVMINDCTLSNQRRGFDVVQGGSTTGEGAPGAIQIFNTFCLEVPGGVDTSGTKLEISTCTAGDPNQLWEWNSDGTVVWSGHNKCLDLTDGDLENGNQLQIWTCTANNSNQRWTTNPLANPLSEVVLSANAQLCMGADSSANGAPVFATPCSDTTARKVWTVPQIGHGNSGTYQLAFGPDNTAPFKCLDVTDGKAISGTKLQLWDCTPRDNNQFFLPTGIIRWEGTGLLDPLCVDLTDGVMTRGNQLQIWNCTAGNNNQFWNDVPPPQTAV